MFDLIKSAVGAATKLAKAHPVLTGVSLATMVLPRLFGAGASPQALTGLQQAIGGQLPPQGAAPPQTGAPAQSPGYW
jgi:hypothetical protein